MIPKFIPVHTPVDSAHTLQLLASLPKAIAAVTYRCHCSSCMRWTCGAAPAAHHQSQRTLLLQWCAFASATWDNGGDASLDCWTAAIRARAVLSRRRHHDPVCQESLPLCCLQAMCKAHSARSSQQKRFRSHGRSGWQCLRCGVPTDVPITPWPAGARPRPRAHPSPAAAPATLRCCT
jgi:hypothetical protein